MPFSLLSPSSLLKLPIVLIQKFCYHGNMTSLFCSLLSSSRFSSSFNNVITPAPQCSANTHFTLPITPFVTPHLRATYPAHFHLIDAMCLTMSFAYSAVTNFLLWSRLSQIYGQYLPLHCPLRRSQLVLYALRVFLISGLLFSVDRGCPFFRARWFIPLVSTNLDTGIGYPYARSRRALKKIGCRLK